MVKTLFERDPKEWVRLTLLGRHYEATRRGRRMRESYNVSIRFYELQFKSFGKPRDEEFTQYSEMMISQLPRFNKYLKLDKFSRRLIIQFPMDWWEASDTHYMPCIESFLIQFITESKYIVCVNFRSSEASRTLEDLGLVKMLCETMLDLKKYRLLMVAANFFNVHEYLDGGTSDNFTAKTYLEVKRE